MALRAAARGISALGLADRDGIHGAVPFQKACEAHGIQPILGTDCADPGGSRARLLALDAEGWGGVCRPGLLGRVAAQRGPEDLFALSARTAQATGLPHIAAPRVAFVNPESHRLHRLLVAIGRNDRISRLPPAAAAPPSAWLEDAARLAHRFRENPGALREAEELAERATFRIPLGQRLLPRFPVAGGGSAQARLARMCERGFRRRRVTGQPGYRAQLNRELALIGEQGLADYFLIVADIAAFARREGLGSCGRGSSANSLVVWLLGLTEVDPVRNGLWFDRFLHRGRLDFPDVDLDFAWDERDRVLSHVLNRWGRDRVAMISTHATFARRGAVREAALALGLPQGEVEAFRRRWRPDGPAPEEPWARVVRMAEALKGFPRHVGVHPGGTVVAPSPLTDHLPLQHARKHVEGRPVTVTQWDMGPVEEAGLLKIDLLGNRGLAVIRDAAASVRRNTGLALDPARLDPEADFATTRMLASGGTMGCFYIESPGMRQLLEKLRCRDFSTLVAASSIIRPGIASSGMMAAYVDRFLEVRRTGRHDPDWYLHPVMRSLLEETFGVMTYQEDVLRVAGKVAGMDAADADGLRKAMSRKKAADPVEKWRDRFIGGVRAAGWSEDAAAELWRQVDSFSGYSFCKAHSASYARVSLQSAWLKAHHPAEFMAAVLKNQGGFYGVQAYLSEGRRLGLALRPPCVQKSVRGFSGGRGEVRAGLGEIGSLGERAATRILETRRVGGPFVSMDDLASRAEPPPAAWEMMVKSGALDGIPDGLNRAERMRWAALHARGRPGGGGRLLPPEPLRPPPGAPEFSRRTLLEQEYEALGFLMTAHPLELHAAAVRESSAIPAREVVLRDGGRARMVGWQVARKPVRTRDGRRMMFLTLEDTTALPGRGLPPA